MADQLLEQLRQALEAYLAQGEDTPVAAEAHVLMEAIDQVAPDDASAADAGPMDDTAGAAPDVPPMDSQQPPDVMPRTFADANKTAIPRLESLNAAQDDPNNPLKKKSKAY